MTALLRVSAGVLLALCVTAGAFGQVAIDWGGSLTTTSTVQSVPEDSDDDTVLNSERLVLYFSAPLGQRWEFVSQAAATFNSEPVFAVDAEKLYVQNTIDFSDETVERDVEQSDSLLQLVTRLGRFSLTEPTGLVLTHPVDGVNLTVNGVRSRIDLGLGYSGFVNNEFSRLSMSLEDSIDAEDDQVYFGPARLVGRGTLAFPNLIAGQNLSLAFAFQQDLRDSDEVIQDGTTPENRSNSGGLLDTQYAIVHLDGSVPGVGSLFYGIDYIFNTGRTIGLLVDNSVDAGESYQYKPVRAHLLRGNLSYFMSDFFSSAARVGVTYSSGDEDYQSFVEGNTSGQATMFTAATPAGTGAVFGLQSGNSTIAEVSWGMRPFSGDGGLIETLFARAALYTYFRSTAEGPVSAATVDAGSSGSYLGNEIDLDFRWRPFSDLGVGLTTGFLFANDDVLVAGSDSFEYVIRLNASLSF